MKAIITKYHGPASVKGSRYSAEDNDGNRVMIEAEDELSSDGNHKAAVEALCKKMKWTGKFISGEATINGKKVEVWVRLPLDLLYASRGRRSSDVLVVTDSDGKVERMDP